MADFGLSKSLYEKLYYKQEKDETVKLPVKWMAIESINDGIFSEKSDVVSKSISFNFCINNTHTHSGHLE